MRLRQFLLLSTAWVIALANDEQDNGGPNHLPTFATARHYSINLTIPTNFYQTKRFTGTVEITARVLRPTNFIILDSSGIKYTNSVMVLDSIERKSIPVTLVDREIDRIILTTHEELYPRDYILRFADYEGIIREDMFGLYLSSYTNEKNEREYMVATQLQPTYARRVFPCFDEPKFKASFTLTITRPADYIALSNTGRTLGDNGNIDRFGETPPMSTYTLAFIVAKIKGYSSSQHIDMRMAVDVWCREEALPTAYYAYEMSQTVLKELSDHIGINYYHYMPKLDLVAIPDLSGGAMENWGLLTFRESSLLWEKEESTEYGKQNILLTIVHEISHMWFGNLVTLDWWTHVWLQEGFATYYEYRITAELEPDWELDKRFVVEEQLLALEADAYDNSPALNDPARTPSDIKKKFDAITYRKGASLVKMLVNIMGEDNFNEGIQKYLGENSYRNVEPSLLYKSLSQFKPIEELPTDLDRIMFTWTEIPGYPVVMVHRNSSGFIFTQKRFLQTSRQSPYKWYVPITYTTEERPNFANTTVTAWLLPARGLFIPNNESKGWMVANLLGTGYYRVNYEDELWQALIKALNAKNFTDVFPEVNRALIVDDAMNLARVGAISYETALAVTSFLQKDTSYYPWYTAFNMFDDLIMRFSSSSYVGKTLRKHLLKLMTNLRKSVDFDVKIMRAQHSILKAALTLDWACKLEEYSCVLQSNILFNNYMLGSRVDPNIRSIVYCSAIRQDKTDFRWRFLWGKYQETKLANDRELILSALGCSKNETILKEYLHLSLNASSGIRKQNFYTVLLAVLNGNPTNYRVAFDFVKENIEEIAKYIKGIFSLERLVFSFAERLRTEQEIDEYDGFLVQRNKLIGSADGGMGVLRAAKRNLRWVKSNTGEIEGWLREKYDSASGLVTVTSALIWGSLVAVVL